MVISWRDMARGHVLYVFPLFIGGSTQKKTCTIQNGYLSEESYLITAESGADPTSFSIP